MLALYAAPIIPNKLRTTLRRYRTRSTVLHICSSERQNTPTRLKQVSFEAPQNYEQACSFKSIFLRSVGFRSWLCFAVLHIRYVNVYQYARVFCSENSVVSCLRNHLSVLGDSQAGTFEHILSEVTVGPSGKEVIPACFPTQAFYIKDGGGLYRFNQLSNTLRSTREVSGPPGVGKDVAPQHRLGNVAQPILRWGRSRFATAHSGDGWSGRKHAV